MNRNLLWPLILILCCCSNKPEKHNFVLNKQERHEFINEVYQNELKKGFVYLYDASYTPQIYEDTITVNDVVFRSEEYIKKIEIWDEKILNKNFFVIKTNEIYESDTLFDNKVLLMLSQPIIDVTGKYVLIAEQKFYNGHVLDLNTYIYTKNDKNEWIVYYKLNVGKGFD